MTPNLNVEGKKYQVIYADPPWSYNDKMAGHSFSLDHEYDTQSKDWIEKLPVGSISATARSPPSNESVGL